ncbi:hypothetical protein ABQ137_01070 [Xanthomonas sp. WHRI 8393]|uniref:hypothetical protein n=1 Tax=Xanthomonas sp. WHRI 8393 TaxID=3161574 RepID=UPI0032E89C48
MLNKIIFKLVYWKWKNFDAPAIIKVLRSQGKIKEADALELERRNPAPKDQNEMIQKAKQELLARGNPDEAIKLDEITKKVEHWKKHGGKRPW